MKKLVYLFVVLALMSTLVACGNDNEVTEPQDPTGTVSSSKDEEPKKSDSKETSLDDIENAPETDASKFEYKDVDGGVAITSFNGDDEVVVIPEKIDGKTVVAIDENSFINNKTLLGVRVTDNVKQIGSHSFENCTALKVFISGSGLETVSEFAFGNCTELSEVKLNDGLKSMEKLSFGGTNISEIYIPESVESIDMPFTGDKENTLKVISASGSEAENYVSLYGEALNIVFEAK